MAEVITLTIEDASIEHAIVGSTQYLTVVDDAPDHGQMVGLADDDHPQYVVFEVSAVRPTVTRPGTMWIPQT